MSAPLWLASKGILQLLHHVVDKLDGAQARGKALERSLRLDAKSFPTLYKAEFESEREEQWTHLVQMAQWGWFRIKHDRPRQGQAHYECNPRLAVLNEAAIREAVGRLERAIPAAEQWRDAVNSELRSPPPVRELVSRYKLDIPGHTPKEIVSRLNLLAELRDEPLLLREVSARLFWGLSKVLDNRQDLVAAILDVEECPFPEMPVQLQVFLPADGFGGVLFIENLATFEQASRNGDGRFKGLALVFASGFKGSAKRLRMKGGASVYFAGHGGLSEEKTGAFLAWLRASLELPCWFWGDLDYSGMRILAALRTSFPNLEAWEPGYAPMVAELAGGGGHTAVSAGKALQRPVVETGSAFADKTLLPSIRGANRFVDQELA
jgi:hypothetical protein